MNWIHRVVMTSLLIGPAACSPAMNGGNGDGNTGPTLYAADGAGSATPMLYTVDVTNAAATAIGPIGFAVNGIAFAPGGTLYGVTAGDTPQLITINTTSGAGTMVADLTGTVEDITHTTNQLLGWQTDANGPDFLVSIDTANGTTTRIGIFDSESTGSGLEFGGATDANVGDDLVAFAATATVDPMTDTTFTFIDAADGSFFFGDSMMGNTGNVTALGYHQGQLYAVDGYDAAGARLGTINPTMGQFVLVGNLPDNISGIASSTK